MNNLTKQEAFVIAEFINEHVFNAIKQDEIDDIEWLATLKQHGITHLNLANNHSIDQGRDGLMDTKQNIMAAGMMPFGRLLLGQTSLITMVIAL